jgi:hypothetical protein
MTSNGFNLHISGAQFTAALQLTSTACKQSISITPKGFDISRISIGLGSRSRSTYRCVRPDTLPKSHALPVAWALPK